VTGMALASRALLLASAENSTLETDNSECIPSPNDYIHALMVSMCNTLPGMDVNDPPKTLATMQLFGSIFSNVSIGIFILAIKFCISGFQELFLREVFCNVSLTLSF
jgi:hypothetical protein